MKKIMKKISDGITKQYIAAKAALSGNNGQFVVDHAVVFVIIIVLGALALVLMKNFLSNSLAPTLNSKLMEFFN